MSVKRADWVSSCGVIGLVKRVAKDGAWADVDFRTHTKRMPVSSLKVETTLRFGEYTITDMTRESELAKEASQP